jgi:flagellar basal body-associated protein FliL
MNKQTKLWLSVGVVAAAAYYFWNKKKKEDAAAPKANAVGKYVRKPLPYGSMFNRATDIAGNTYYVPY